MLLVKKKKYAAIRLQFKGDGKSYQVAVYSFSVFVHLVCPVFCCIIKRLVVQEVMELKGIDAVRRDWSLLSKELGNFCLAQIFSGGSVAHSLTRSVWPMGLNFLSSDCFQS